MSDPTSSRKNKRRRKPSNQFAEQHRGGGYRRGEYEDSLQHELEELQQDMVSLDFKEQSTERKVELLSAIICKQSSLILTMKDNIYRQLSRRSLLNEFVILNKSKSIPSEDFLKAVKETLIGIGVTEDIDFEDMYRRGPPRHDSEDAPRPIIVRLHRRDIVNKILTMAIKRNPKGRSLPKIDPHLPEQLRQQRAKLGLIAHKKYVADKSCKIKMKADHVEINGEKFKDNVQTASPNEILFLEPRERADIQCCEFIRTDTITCKGSSFQLFIAEIPSIEYCHRAHLAIATIPSVASKTHLISAYSLSSGEIGWQDDGDHGLGRFLYKTMENCGIQNSICFLTRHYGGVHIGKRRYEIIQQLAQEILLNMSAGPDKHGNKRYSVYPPEMTLTNPSEKEKWQFPRRTAQPQNSRNPPWQPQGPKHPAGSTLTNDRPSAECPTLRPTH